MFVMDLPDVPPQYAPVVIAQAAQAKAPAKTERTIGVCHLIENKPESRLSAVNSISPAAEVWSYLKRQEHTVIDEAGYKAAKMTLLQAPEHGELKLYEETQSGRYFAADPNYVGTDHATVLVEIGGFKVKVMYFFNVMPHVGGGSHQGDPYDDLKNCPNGEVWKILFNEIDPTGQLLTFNSSTQLTSYLAGTINADIHTKSGTDLINITGK